MNTFSKNYKKMYVESYNRASNYMNSEGIEKFNAAQKKKYGSSYASRKGYDDDFMNEFQNRLEKEMNRSLSDFLKNDPDSKRAKALVDKYGMEKWDDLAKNNEEAMNALQKLIDD